MQIKGIGDIFDHDAVEQGELYGLGLELVRILPGFTWIIVLGHRTLQLSLVLVPVKAGQDQPLLDALVMFVTVLRVCSFHLLVFTLEVNKCRCFRI